MSRIRQSAAYAAAEAGEAANAVEATAKLILEIAAGIQEGGLTIEIESIAGFHVPKTILRLRPAEPQESEGER